MAATTRKVPVRRWVNGLKAAMPILLDVNAAILLSVGANMMYAPAGWITAGLATLAINWRLHGD